MREEEERGRLPKSSAVSMETAPLLVSSRLPHHHHDGRQKYASCVFDDDFDDDFDDFDDFDDDGRERERETKKKVHEYASPKLF